MPKGNAVGYGLLGGMVIGLIAISPSLSQNVKASPPTNEPSTSQSSSAPISSTPSHKTNFMAEHEVKKYLKKVLHDAESLKDLNCQYHSTNNATNVQTFECSYRARNTMGGYLLKQEDFMFDNNGDLMAK